MVARLLSNLVLAFFVGACWHIGQQSFSVAVVVLVLLNDGDRLLARLEK
jgi:hypothetical protein